ncbi:MAG: colanic acid biosynthesis glycosyltransferase WcaL, partial [bacterium]
MVKNASIKLGYLVSQYPGISHTFIFREVQQLRKLGFDVRVASINEANLPLEGRSEEERGEVAHTFCVKRQGVIGALSAIIKTLFSPAAFFLRGLVFSISLGGYDLRRLAYHFFYFLEALILGCWMEREGLTHLHVHFANAASTVALILSKTFPYTYSISV